MIGWVIYAVGVILCATAAFVGADDAYAMTIALVILGIGCLVGAFVYGVNQVV